MTFILVLLLMLSAIYCGGMYVYLAYRHMTRFGEDWSEMTFRLGLCFILAIGFLLMSDSTSRVGYQLEKAFQSST